MHNDLWMRTSLGESTIEALRLIKDALLQYPSIFDNPIPRSLKDNVKDARKRYMADLESIRQIEQEEAARKRELDAKNKVEFEKSEIFSVISDLYNNYRTAWQLRMTLLRKEVINLKSLKKYTKHQLQRAHSKIEMILK